MANANNFAHIVDIREYRIDTPIRIKMYRKLVYNLKAQDS